MVAGISMVRDEADIVEPIVRHMATQVDFLIVADNRSADGTRELLDSLAAQLPLTVVDEPQIGYYQSRTVTGLAERAGERGAEWVVPFDADEWFHSPHGRIADVLGERPEEVALAVSHNHVATAEDDPAEPNPLRRIGWREADRFLPKVACRVLPRLTIAQGNHFADYGRKVRVANDLLAIRHFPYRSAEQFARKIANGVAAVEAASLDETICIHWRRYGPVHEQGGAAALERAFYERHFRKRPSEGRVVEGEVCPPLVFDPVHRLEGAMNEIPAR